MDRVYLKIILQEFTRDRQSESTHSTVAQIRSQTLTKVVNSREGTHLNRWNKLEIVVNMIIASINLNFHSVQFMLCLKKKPPLVNWIAAICCSNCICHWYFTLKVIKKLFRFHYYYAIKDVPFLLFHLTGPYTISQFCALVCSFIQLTLTFIVMLNILCDDLFQYLWLQVGNG